MLRVTSTILLSFLALVATACGPGSADGPAGDGPFVVATTFEPTTSFVRRLVADLPAGTVEVYSPLPAGEDPAGWRPPREVLVDYQSADLIVVNGAGFEEWVEGASLPQSRLLDTSARFADEFIVRESAPHSHGGEAEHTHEGIDGHVWLDPILATAQVGSIADALAARLNGHGESVRSAGEALEQDLSALGQRLDAIAPKLARATVLANHPAYDYLARRYGWDVTNFDLDPDSPLDDHDFEHVRDAVVAGPGVRIMLWESEPLPATAARLADELGLASVVYAPGESPRADGLDWLALMHANVDRLAAALP